MLDGHKPVVIEQMNGLWANGDVDSCPLDHFTDCENVVATGESGIKTRDGLGPHQHISGPVGNVIRVFNFITQDSNDLLVLREGGDIFHVLNNGLTVLGPILSIPSMTDFNILSYAGRAYITPFGSFSVGANIIEKGLENEFLYVYLGDGTPARKAAGLPPSPSDLPASSTITVANDGGQLSDAGDHLFGVSYETDTGYQTAPSRLTLFTSNGTGFDFSGIPVSGSSAVVARHLVMTKKITNYNGDTTGYQYFFIPNGRIPNNTATTLSNITVFDADLLEDASHLFDNYSEIPAGVGLSLYHNRLVLNTTFTDISLALVSSVGEPEAISQIDGLIIAPLDGTPLTVTQEMRDVIYMFKRSKTHSYVDNGDVPSSWPLTTIDEGFGAPVHGVATVVDSGGINVDFIITTSFRGIMIFNGRYFSPELSYKIRNIWNAQNKNEFRNIQIVNNTPGSIFYLALPDRRLLIGDYGNGLDPKKIKWFPERFDIQVNSVALVNTSELIIGSNGQRIP